MYIEETLTSKRILTSAMTPRNVTLEFWKKKDY